MPSSKTLHATVPVVWIMVDEVEPTPAFSGSDSTLLSCLPSTIYARNQDPRVPVPIHCANTCAACCFSRLAATIALDSLPCAELRLRYKLRVAVESGRDARRARHSLRSSPTTPQVKMALVSAPQASTLAGHVSALMFPKSGIGMSKV
jgi:hypothetical protein